jgi:hypothetical protein
MAATEESIDTHAKALRDRTRPCASCPAILGVELAADSKDPTRCGMCAEARRHRAFIKTLPLTVACARCDERFPAEDGTHRDCPKAPPTSHRCRLCNDPYPEGDGYKGYCGLDCYTDAKPHWRREYD